MEDLKVKEFFWSFQLTAWVNKNNVKIESIVGGNFQYTLFYREILK